MKRSEARKCAVIAEVKAYKEHVIHRARRAILELEQQDSWVTHAHKDKPKASVAIQQKIEQQVDEMLGHLAMIESFANQTKERIEHEIDIHEED